MKRLVLCATLGTMIGFLGTLAIATEPTAGRQSPADGGRQMVGIVKPTAEPKNADALFQQLVTAKGSRGKYEAADALGKMGKDAIPRLLEGFRSKDYQVQTECLQRLVDRFADDPAVFAAILAGLNDRNTGIKYTCAFYLGKIGNKAAIQPLRKLLTDHDAWPCYAAAKSLAQLGEKDRGVLTALYLGLGNDRYMIRMMSNAGVRAITGKDLNDFKYDWGEGAAVSGGNEYIGELRPIHDAELRASRFQAVARFCRWLKKEKPELYAILAPSPEADK